MIPLLKPHVTGKEIAAVNEVLNSGSVEICCGIVDVVINQELKRAGVWK